jgi:hypothetical protein
MARAPKQAAPKVVRDEEGLARLRESGVTRALTLWPEWGVAFTMLDKRVENRPMPPFRNLVGERIAFHMGKWIGGRKAGEFEGLHSLFSTAAESGWKVYRPHETIYTLRKRAPKELVRRDAGSVLALDYEAEREGDIKIRVPEDIITSAITFTGVLGGFHYPTADPKVPWQVGTQRDDKPSFAWIIEGVEVLETPVTCPGWQGVWTL